MFKVRTALREELFVKGLPDYVRKLIKEKNIFSNPRKDRQKKALSKWSDENIKSLPPAKRQELKKKANAIKWTLNKLPDQIFLCREIRDWIAIPIGFMPEALKIMEHCGMTPEFEDERICPAWDDPPEIQGTLFPYQAAAMPKILRYERGTIQAPTGSGKTNLLLTLPTVLKTPTIITVHTSELFRQTVERCQEWLDYDPGKIQGGRKPKIRDITIAMMQTLSARDFKQEGWWDRFGCIIVDECHHAPADTWADVLRRFPCKYKYGTTATAWRKDKMEFLIWRMIGEIIAKIKTSEVKAAGKIVVPQIMPVPTPYWYDIDDASEWTKMISDLISNEERNWCIRDKVLQVLDKNPKSKALILTDRIDHTRILGNMLAGFKPVLLHGELKAQPRRENMELVRAGARLTIATTHLLGEGIDVPSWDLLFLVTPVVGGPKTLQIVGRVARPSEDKDRSILFDFVDDRVQMLKSAFYARKKLYGSLNK